jgi:serine/threonine-protein kinase HipA
VKSAGEDYPYLAQNEYMCMEVARHCNFNVPEFWLSDDCGLFIMGRFDRTGDGKKVGLEDMAVLMGKSPDEKYNSSYEMVAKVVDTYCGDNAPESKARLFEYIALSVLLKNGDAHLKNFSLVYDTPGGDVKLSPLYDVVTTNIYEIENPKTGATKVDNMMALNMFKTKSYPTNEELITYGKNICMVKQPERVIERIEEAKRSVIKTQAERMNKELIEKLKKSWQIF